MFLTKPRKTELPNRHRSISVVLAAAAMLQWQINAALLAAQRAPPGRQNKIIIRVGPNLGCFCCAQIQIGPLRLFLGRDKKEARRRVGPS